MERLSASRPRWKRFSEGCPKRPPLLSEITNPFILLTRGTACLNCWAVTLELDARTPHIHDVVKNLHNVTKNKVMEMQREALYSWVLDPESFPDAGEPARRWCLPEEWSPDRASCGVATWHGGGTMVSQQPCRQPGFLSPGNISQGSPVPSPLGPQLLPFLSPRGKGLTGHSRNTRKILLGAVNSSLCPGVWKL